MGRDTPYCSADHRPLIQSHFITGGSGYPSNLRTRSKPLLLETKGRDAQVGAGGERTLSTRKGNPCHCFRFQGTRTFLTSTTESTAPIFREQKNPSPLRFSEVSKPLSFPFRPPPAGGQGAGTGLAKGAGCTFKPLTSPLTLNPGGGGDGVGILQGDSFSK